MKKIFKYISVFLSIALMGAFTSCNLLEPEDEVTEVVLGIKTFSPAKVVPGMEMTINGSCFDQVTEIVFPGEVSVSSFKKVTNEMIRVTVPKGVSAEGGKLVVKGEGVLAESNAALTIGKTQVSGFSKQAGEEISGGEQLTVFGTDLEFINKAEFLDADSNVLEVSDAEFYRKGTSNLILIVPKNTFEGSYVGKLYTIDGKVFPLPELSYKKPAEGGHWEIKEEVIWENPDPEGNGPANWNGTYRFAPETNSTGEEIAIIPTDLWERMKSEKFYLLAQGSDWVQMRIVSGWWNHQWPAGKEEDITPDFQGERLIDNGDGTFYIEIDLAGHDLAANMDAEHLLFTGSGYTPLKLYFLTEEWVDGGGHMEIVKTSIWKNPDPEGNGPANWNGTYRFAPETNPTGEEIAIIPTDLWEKMKTGPFYMLAQGSDWVQMRIVTGWWNYQWPAGKEEDITPNFQGERIIDNGDGTFYIEIDISGHDLAANMDTEHLLFTGSGFTPLELYLQEEVWVGGGGNTPKEVVVWENDDPEGHGVVNWNGTYRFAPETNPTGEEIAVIPTDLWEKMKTGPFYMMAQGSDWVQMRIVTGWWNYQWPAGKEEDITPDFQGERIIDNGDGTFYIEIDISGHDLAANMDTEHLLFTGSGYTPLKIYYYE